MLHLYFAQLQEEDSIMKQNGNLLHVCNAQLPFVGEFLSIGANTTRLTSIIPRPILLWTASDPEFSPCVVLLAIVITNYSQLGVLASYFSSLYYSYFIRFKISAFDLHYYS